jgi:hypothetical protein
MTDISNTIRIALIKGVNKGVGFETARQLLLPRYHAHLGKFGSIGQQI